MHESTQIVIMVTIMITIVVLGIVALSHKHHNLGVKYLMRYRLHSRLSNTPSMALPLLTMMR